jgi:hypothetical protein
MRRTIDGREGGDGLLFCSSDIFVVCFPFFFSLVLLALLPTLLGSFDLRERKRM